jgi:hypothetical protein
MSRRFAAADDHLEPGGPYGPRAPLPPADEAPVP